MKEEDQNNNEKMRRFQNSFHLQYSRSRSKHRSKVGILTYTSNSLSLGKMKKKITGYLRRKFIIGIGLLVTVRQNQIHMLRRIDLQSSSAIRNTLIRTTHL